LALRRSGIGASDISGIMGISPWTTPFQVWASKVSDLPEVMDDEAMMWGRILENVILNEWIKLSEQTLVHRGPLCRNTENPTMVATPDALASDRPIEVKNSSDWSWSEVPIHYLAQVQWQLAVTGYEVGDLVVLHAGRHLEPYEIKADPEAQARMIEAATEFWGYVEANEPPPTQWEDSTIMASLWPTSTEEVAQIDPDDAFELYVAKEARDAGNQRYDAAVATIKAAMKEADTAVSEMQVIATWKTNKNGVRSFKVKGDGLVE
jgi:putative phage-type endonuclease